MNYYFFGKKGNKIFDNLKTMVPCLKDIEFKFDNSLPNAKELEDNSVLLFPSIMDSSNAISYEGVEQAMLWYFHLLQSQKKFAIVLLNASDKLTFFENCKHSQFVKCKQVYFSQLKNIQNVLGNVKTRNSTISENINILKTLGIKPPSRYMSHHSVDNEYAIYRMSKFIGIEVPNQANISSIYFKYSELFNPVNNTVTQKNYLFQGKAKVLLIDDEVNKGWGQFYKKFLEPSPYIEFQYLKYDFASSSKDDIINQALSKVKDFDADIVLLDLRLCDSDFSETTAPTELTGYRILSRIKNEINKGIQVIITTASNKIWNYEALMQVGLADGFVLKSRDSEVKEDFNNLKSILEKSIEKSNFLKKIANDFERIEKFYNSNPDFDSKGDELRNKFNTNFDIAFELLNKALNSPENEVRNKYFNYAYLQLFLCVENFSKHDKISSIENDKFYIICKNDKIEILNGENCKMEWENHQYIVRNAPYKRDLDTNFKMSAILLFRHSLENSSKKGWKKVNRVRNDIAHGKPIDLEYKNFKDLLEFMQFIFDKMSIKCYKKNKDDLLNDLKNKFNNK